MHLKSVTTILLFRSNNPTKESVGKPLSSFEIRCWKILIEDRYLLLDDDVPTSVRCPTVLFFFILYLLECASRVGSVGRGVQAFGALLNRCHAKIGPKIPEDRARVIPGAVTTTANQLMALVKSLTPQFVANSHLMQSSY